MNRILNLKYTTMKNRNTDQKNTQLASNDGYTVLSDVIQPREKPCLCISCPKCGSVFMATALNEDYQNDSEANKELLNDFSKYSRQGYNASFRNASDFNLEYCSHLNIR